MELAKIWWKQDPDAKSHGGRLYLVSTDDLYDADVTWDGCVNLYDSDNKVSLHICNFEDFEQRMTELKLRAIHHFGDTEWPACAPNIPAE